MIDSCVFLPTYPESEANFYFFVVISTDPHYNTNTRRAFKKCLHERRYHIHGVHATDYCIALTFLNDDLVEAATILWLVDG